MASFVLTGEALIFYCCKESVMRNFKIVFSVVLFLLVAGCVTKPGSVQKRSTVVRSLVDVNFEVENLSVEVVDSKTLVVSGNIVNPALVFNVRTKEEWLGVSGWFTVLDGSPGREEKGLWSLSVVDFSWSNLGSDYYGWVDSVKISADGFFKVTYAADDSEYFIKPNEGRRWYSVASSERDLRIGAWYLTDKDKHGKYADLGSVVVYSFRADAEYVEDFGKALAEKHFNTVPVSVEFREQTTRMKLFPEVTITPVDVPTKKEFVESFIPLLEKKFGDDSRLVMLGLMGVESSLPSWSFWGGEIKKENVQVVSFYGLAGGKYKIEVVHDEYYSFSRVLSLDSSFVNKTVILARKDAKGAKGSMIDW